MRTRNIVATAAVALLGAFPCFAETTSPGQRAATASSPTVISQDPLTRQIMLSLTKPNGGVRSFTYTANDKTIELIPVGIDPLAPLKPADGLVNKTEPVKVQAKTKSPAKAMPQLESVAAKTVL